MDADIQSRTSTFCITILLTLGETSPVNFGPVNLEISMWNCTHLKHFFWKTIFRPLGGAAPIIFTCTSAPLPGMGPRLQFFSKEGPKLA